MIARRAAITRTRERVMSESLPDLLRQQTNLANWRQAPYNQWAFHNARQIVPTAAIRAGGSAWQLPRCPMALESTTCTDRYGNTRTLKDVMTYAHTDALLVIHDGAVVTERYLNGMRPEDPHILMSVSKSVTAAVAGVLTSQGLLDPEAAVTTYMPELANSGFAGATLQQVLDMRTGLAFDEDYYVTSGPMIRYREATGWNPRTDSAFSGGLHEFLLSLEEFLMVFVL